MTPPRYHLNDPAPVSLQKSKITGLKIPKISDFRHFASPENPDFPDRIFEGAFSAYIKKASQLENVKNRNWKTLKIACHWNSLKIACHWNSLKYRVSAPE